jgi:ABC-type multidrug transport system permease subunit
LLLIFGAISGDEKIPGRPELDGLTLFVPGILAFGIIVAAYGNLAATVAIRRGQGVLKRVRATPLSPTLYLSGHLCSVLMTSLLIALTTILLGRLVFDVAPRPGVAPVLVAVLTLGITCFAALGLAISGAIRNPEAAGAITNGTYLPLALVSGTFNGTMHLPPWLDVVVSAFPIKALTDSLKALYDPASSGPSLASVLVLATWTIIGMVLARRYFRWDPT